jgi:hypothetical protein
MSVAGEDSLAGPFRLRSSFFIRRWLELALCVAGVVLLTRVFFTGLGELSRISHDQQVWDAGGPQVEAEVSGKSRRHKLIFSSNDLEVSYHAPDGAMHRHALHVSLLGSGLDIERSNPVRLAPGDADDFALGAVVVASGPRRAGALVVLATATIFAPIFAWGVWRVRRRSLVVQRVAAGGKLTLARLIWRVRERNDKGRFTGAEKVCFAVEVPGKKPVEVTYRLLTLGDELLTNQKADGVLVLVDEREPLDAIPLTESFNPFELDFATKQWARSLLGKMPKQRQSG